MSVNITKMEEPDMASITGTYLNSIIIMIITIIKLLFITIALLPLQFPVYCTAFKLWHTCMFDDCPLQPWKLNFSFGGHLATNSLGLVAKGFF